MYKYYYLLDKRKKEVIELIGHSDILGLLNSMKIKYYDAFPYAEAGFEDPYTFMDEYRLIKLSADNNGNLIFVEIEEGK